MLIFKLQLNGLVNDFNQEKYVLKILFWEQVPVLVNSGVVTAKCTMHTQKSEFRPHFVLFKTFFFQKTH
jgi:hypothetical protein